MEKTEREGAGHSLRGGRKKERDRRGGGAWRNKTTPAYHKRRGEKSRLLSEVNKTRGKKKIKGGIFKSLPFTCKPQQPRFHCLGGFIPADLGFLLSEIVSKQTRMCSMRNGRSVGSKQNKKGGGGGGGARCLSSATHHQAFDTASFPFLYFKGGFTLITSMTSASRQTRRDYISMTHFLKYAGLLLQW